MFGADEGEGVLDVVAVLVECLCLELVFRRPEEQSHLLGVAEGLVEELFFLVFELMSEKCGVFPDDGVLNLV